MCYYESSYQLINTSSMCRHVANVSNLRHTSNLVFFMHYKNDLFSPVFLIKLIFLESKITGSRVLASNNFPEKKIFEQKFENH